jgi:putative DNA methylase
MQLAHRRKTRSLHRDEALRDRRLIDVGAMGLEASISGQAERYGRGKTSHTIHVWWARRPHGAMRALVFASLMPPNDGGEEAGVMRDLAFASSSEAEVIKDAQRLLRSRYRGAPKVLDVFGGGGTIPYEAALLGAHACSLDYNPLSVFIQKSNLEFAQEALVSLKLTELADIVKDAGTRILERLRMRTEDLFPLRDSQSGKGVFAYFWTYSSRCGECGSSFLLMKRPWLSRKAGRQTALVVSNAERRQSVAIKNVLHDDSALLAAQSVWTGRNGTVCCPNCGRQRKNISIKDCRDELGAIGDLLKKGKAFHSPAGTAVPSAQYMEDREKKLLHALGLHLPQSRLPKWSGIVNPPLYGINTHADFLNSRQRLVLLELIGALNEEHACLRQKYSGSVVRYVISTLSSLIDQLVDWNCRLSMWISQNEQVGRAFCGPGVPMLWDYVETDPVLRGPANLWDKIERIVAAVGATPVFAERPTVSHGSAQKLPFEAEVFDAVITDPPYYDNLYYNVLADFFYVWKRPVLDAVCPELFKEPQCAEQSELVASQFRHGNHPAAHQWYCIQLTECLREVSRVLKSDGILSFVFAHSSLSAWAAIVQAFRHAGLVLTNAEPLSVERRQRPRAMTSEVVNTCIVLVARKSGRSNDIVDMATLIASVELRARTMAPRLQAYGWRSCDIGMAIFAHGVTVLANAPRVSDAHSDLDALQRLGEAVQTIIPDFKLQARESL